MDLVTLSKTRLVLASVALLLLVASAAVWLPRTGSPRDLATTPAAGAPVPPSSTTVVPAPMAFAADRPAPRSLDHEPRVAFFGDSLGVESNPHLQSMMVEAGGAYLFDGFGGTATCDYLAAMRRAASDFRPDVVVLFFSGNGLTRCMTTRTSDERGILIEMDERHLDAFERAYTVDTAEAIDVFGPSVDVVLVGFPITRNGVPPGARLVDEMYRRVADERPNVHYLPLTPLLTLGGMYADELPCTFVEPCVVGESVPVRAPDGAHLCPPEPTFCFGGFRVSMMIADAISQLVASGTPS